MPLLALYRSVQTPASQPPEKGFGDAPPVDTVSTGSSITYRYLTFETPLSEAIGESDVGVPGFSDLSNYISPFSWSSSRKAWITWLSCGVTAVTAYTAGSYSPPAEALSIYWDVSHAAILVGITTFTTGFAIAPLFLAPFSELNGRRPVFIVTGILFVVSQLCCAVTRSFPGMLVARFFSGVGGSTFSTMVGGVISDIYHKDGWSQDCHAHSIIR